MIRRGVLAVAAVLALALSACSAGSTPAPAPSTPDTVAGTTLLVKASGWRKALGPGAEPYVLVEIAYDADAARRAWAENVPADAEVRAVTDAPYEEGRRGSLEGVDLTKQRLVVVSAGESSSCRGWIRGLKLRADGTIDVLPGAHVTSPDGACTADYRSYRMVLAVDADALPARAALGENGAKALLDGRTIGDVDVVVSAYPYVRPPF